MGINLFILECKYLTGADLRYTDLRVLIFSYWNVNHNEQEPTER